jgi:hypothetical protein
VSMDNGDGMFRLKCLWHEISPQMFMIAL